MHVLLRTTSVLFAMSIVAACDNDHDHLDAGTPTPATGFVSANLISDQQGVASHFDPTLVNAWGLAMDSTSFWISNNGSGRILVVAPDGSPSKFSPPASALDVVPVCVPGCAGDEQPPRSTSRPTREPIRRMQNPFVFEWTTSAPGARSEGWAA